MVLRGFKIFKKVGRTVGLGVMEPPCWGRVSGRFPGEARVPQRRLPHG